MSDQLLGNSPGLGRRKFGVRSDTEFSLSAVSPASTASEARRDLAAWLQRWQGKYPKLTDWVEENIEETFAFYRLPRQHHKHLKSTNMLERYNQEIKRRTHIVRVFPNGASCLRLIRALAVETHEDWLEANRYINMKLLKEDKRELMKEAA